MSRFSHYGTGQRFGFGMVCVAFGLCLIGALSPYWLSAETSIKDLKVLGLDVGDIPLIGNLIGDIKVFKMDIGLWTYCIDLSIIDEGEKCYTFYSRSDKDQEDGFDWIQLARFTCSLNVLLGLLCGIAACCRGCCCSGGRTICHGIFALLSGVSGIMAVVIIYKNTKGLVGMPLINVDYDWSCTIFLIGSIMMIIASLLLCFARPREAIPYGMVMAPQPSGVSVNVSQTSVSQYNMAGQINSFEPLPNPSALQNTSAAPPAYSYK